MSKYEVVVPWEMDQLVKYMECGLENGRIAAAKRESSDWRFGGTRGKIRVYEQSRFPYTEECCLTLSFVAAEGLTKVTAITAGSGRPTYYGREECMQVRREPYLMELVKNLLEGYDLKIAE